MLFVNDAFISESTLILNVYTFPSTGVELAVQKLREYESDPAGSTLIVITDGEQNSHPYIQDVLQKVRSKNCTVLPLMKETVYYKNHSVLAPFRQNNASSFSHVFTRSLRLCRQFNYFYDYIL